MFTHLRFALRQYIKAPGFAFVAIATLALGIGACSAMFSVVNAVLLRPLPFLEPDRLVWIENNGGTDLSGRTTRADTFLGWRAQAKSFESLSGYFAFFDYGRITLMNGGATERLRGVNVSDNFLPTLGVSLWRGRNFTAEECLQPAYPASQVVILDYRFWQRRFAGDPSIVGRTITLNNAPATVVGILPASFDFASLFAPGTAVDLLTPFPLTPVTATYGNTLFGIGRLRAGVTAEQAQAELAVVNARLLHTTLTNIGSFGAAVRPLDAAIRGRFREAFLLLAGAVACVLAIACVNLSNLLLARINVRRQEFAVRVAIGARPIDLALQTLTESLLLAGAGCLVGIPAAAWATRLLARLQTFGVPLLGDASVDGTALAVTIGLTLLAGIACGVLPALHLAWGHRSQGLQNATHQRTAGRSATGARDALIVAEVALACVLLVGAGLLLRSFTSVLRVNLGFQPKNAMAWRIDFSRPFKTYGEVITYASTLVKGIEGLPGVESVGLSDTLPLGRNRTWGAGETGIQYPPGAFPAAEPRLVDTRYLQTMQIPLLEGRYYDQRDSANGPPTIIINEALAKELSPNRSMLGRKVAVYGDRTVIGIVGNVRNSSLEADGSNEMYLNISQCNDWSAVELVVRSSLSPRALVPEVRAALATFDPALPSAEFHPLEHLVDDAVAPRRLITELLGFFSVLALGLAALGLYGVISYSVGQRTQEIGIRMAVGAQRADVLRLVLLGGMRLIGLGVVLGIVGALALTRLLQGLLYGVTAHDPAAFAANVALIAAVGGLACMVPALRATRIDPIQALRSD
jgi:putative ABC transport system permease protein